MRAVHPAREPRERRAVRLLHTSDVHLGAHYRSGGKTEGQRAEESLRMLVEVARDAHCDLMVIAGDFFDSNRVSQAVGERASDILAAVRIPVIILPGNHDPLVEGSVYEAFSSHFPDNVQVLRSQEDGVLHLNGVNVQLWGQAHLSYEDFDPCAASPDWNNNGKVTDWRIAMAHGHFVRGDYDERFSYRIRGEDLGRLEADYVALGHWDTHEFVGADDVIAYYSGSPGRVQSMNLIDFRDGQVEVERFVLRPHP